MKDLSIGGLIMLDRSTEIGVDEKEEVGIGAWSDNFPLTVFFLLRSWSPSWSTEEEPVQTTARKSPRLQSRLNTRRIENFSFYGDLL